MTTDTLEELENQVVRTACPRCNRRSLELRIHCEFDRDECLYVVHCVTCDGLYEVDLRSVELAHERPVVEDLMRALLCPRCMSPSVALTFQCDLRTHECAYRTACKSCGAVV